MFSTIVFCSDYVDVNFINKKYYIVHIFLCFFSTFFLNN